MLQGETLQGDMLHWEKCYGGEMCQGETLQGELFLGDLSSGRNGIHPLIWKAENLSTLSLLYFSPPFMNKT